MLLSDSAETNAGKLEKIKKAATRGRDNQHGRRQSAPSHARTAFFRFLKFFRQLWIADLVRKKIGNSNAHSVLHFTRAKIMQERSPTIVLFQIFSRCFDSRMCPASPHSITRWAMLIPAPATFAR